MRHAGVPVQRAARVTVSPSKRKDEGSDGTCQSGETAVRLRAMAFVLEEPHCAGPGGQERPFPDGPGDPEPQGQLRVSGVCAPLLLETWAADGVQEMGVTTSRSSTGTELNPRGKPQIFQR